MQRFQQLPLHAPHPALLSSALHVVIASKMQNAVDEQKTQLLIEPRLSLFCLPERGNCRNDNITQELRLDVGKQPFGHGEG